MNCEVVYGSFSKKGNTKKLANAVAGGAGVTAKPIAEAKFDSAVDLLFVGASLYAGKLNAKMDAFLRSLPRDKVKQVAVFGTSMSGDSTLPLVKEALEGSGIAVRNEAFICKASFLFFGKGTPTEADLSAAKAFAASLKG